MNVSAFVRRRVRASEDGMSLMEVLMAIFMLTIVMAAAGGFFINSLKSTGGESQHQIAIDLADQALDDVQAVPVGQLLTGRTQAAVTTLLATPGATALTASDLTASGNFDPAATGTSTQAVPTSALQTVNSVKYTVRTFIDQCFLTTSTGVCGPVSSNSTTQLFRITVDVSWTASGANSCSGGCDYSASTLLDPHTDATFNTNISQPTISMVNPAAVAVNTNQTLTLTGTTFVAGATVTIGTGGGTVGAIVTNTGTIITVPLNTAGDSPGVYTLTVINPDGGRATYNVSEDPQPSITGITPATVADYASSTISLTGTNFQTAGSLTVSAGTSSSASITSTTAAKITGFTQTGANPGTITVTMTNPDGGSATATFTTTTSAPTLTAVSPTPIASGSTKTLTLTGTGLQSSGASVTASSGTITSLSVTSTTSATVSYTAPILAGTYSLTFTNSDGGQASINVTVTAAPTITTASSTNLTHKQAGVFTVVGTGFQTGATVSLTENGTAVIPSNVTVTATQVTFTGTNANITGTVTFVLKVTNPDGSSATYSVIGTLS